MTQINQADKRDEYIRELRAIESSLGSAETILFIQEQNARDRAKFFDLKSDIAICRSRLERERLDTIALRLEQLGNDFSQGISNLKNALNNLDNITEILSVIDILVGTLTRIFI
jgi:molecular chaperone GrpE (heat shock protein)